jgi:hypothetical protein
MLYASGSHFNSQYRLPAIADLRGPTRMAIVRAVEGSTALSIRRDHSAGTAWPPARTAM